MRNRRASVLAASTLILILSGSIEVLAQQAEPIAAEARDAERSRQPEGGANVVADAAKRPVHAWTFRAEPVAWFVAPGGDVTIPGTTTGGTSFSLDDTLNLDEPEFTPLVELHAARGRWRATVSGYFIDQEATVSSNVAGSFGDVPVSTGDTIASEFSFTSFQAAGAYAFDPYRAAPNGRGGHDFVATLEVMAGARAHYVDFDFGVTPPGGSTTTTGADEFFVEPFGGVKGTLDIREHFTVDVEFSLGGFSVGGDRSSFSADVMVGGMWRPVRNVGLQIGFRQQFFNLTDGDGASEFEFDGTAGGVFAGLEFRH